MALLPNKFLNLQSAILTRPMVSNICCFLQVSVFIISAVFLQPILILVTYISVCYQNLFSVVQSFVFVRTDLEFPLTDL